MDRRSTSLRIVTVTRDGLLTPADVQRLQSAGFEVEQVDSPYEGAAEMLRAATAAVAVDLPVMGCKHLRMLDLARKLGVVVFAVGPVPSGLGSAELSGVRLVGARELPDALARSVQEVPQPPRAEEEGPPREGPASEPGRYETQPRPQAYEEQSKAPASVGEQSDVGADREDPSEAGDHPGSGAKEGESRPRRQSDILSSDEISALLEEDL